MNVIILILMVMLVSSCMPRVDTTMPAYYDRQQAEESAGDADTQGDETVASGSVSGSESGSSSSASEDDGDSGESGDNVDAEDSDESGDVVDEPIEAPIIRPSWLIISEILYDVPGSDTDGDVFIELAGEASTEIGGYEIALVNGSDGKVYDTIAIPEGAIIPEDGIFVIADAITGSPETTRVNGADFINNFDPQNGPDAIQLIDDTGALIDVVAYGQPVVELAENGLAAFEGTPAQDVASGMSLARVDTFDTNDNSLDFIQLEIPSPGVVEVTE